MKQEIAVTSLHVFWSPVGDLESLARIASNRPHQIDAILSPRHRDHRRKELTRASGPSIVTGSRSRRHPSSSLARSLSRARFLQRPISSFRRCLFWIWD
ncbi:hypothetical protein TIFTF001_014902 [Ficus carica]|uniref:Uncharacterized protein n=1 Tax=Ficus carica TaxID=3494 RepID=A0AA88A679_FICCA|nr:hypothetical protein TIFTF001_014902 [Ficus carica]